MQVQFPKKMLRCLNSAVEEVKNTELTQELRLSDGLPDIGRIIGVWGQVMLRSKQWQSNEIGLSGGVKVWVLYAPEDNTEPRVMEGWLPFQMKWDARCSGREGPVRLMPLLRFADGRSLSARKIMIRAGVSVMAQGMCPMEVEIYVPEELPPEAQVLRHTYPVRLSVEAGEKTFQVDEDLELPSGSRLISYDVSPEITECRILGDKLAFKGRGNLHCLIRDEEGKLRGSHHELPFSQLVDLDNAWGADASGDVRLAVTDLEAESSENGQLRVKSAMVAQYLVDDRQLLELAEDAYCPGRQLKYETAAPEIPAVLEERTEVLKLTQMLSGEDGPTADIRFMPDHPRIHQRGEMAEVEFPGAFQILCYREDGTLHCTLLRTEENLQIPLDGSCRMSALVQYLNQPQITPGAEGLTLSAAAGLQLRTNLSRGIPMIMAMDMGPETEEEHDRPSVILRRASNDSLWEIAKASGSTVEAIQNANEGTDHLTSDRMLLIPTI